ncbi:MAG: hypothetical protein VKJ06_03045, partial [Vampirovibrionales bacterium]|nr:hypothetical protein [Vampirovibrionales bacterium]
GYALWGEGVGLITAVSGVTYPEGGAQWVSASETCASSPDGRYLYSAITMDRTNSNNGRMVFNIDTNNIKRYQPLGQLVANGTPIKSTSTLYGYEDAAQVNALGFDMEGHAYTHGPNGTIAQYNYQANRNRLHYTDKLDVSATTPTVSALAIDPGSSRIALLDGTNLQIDVYNDRNASGSASPSQQIGTAATTPTGLAINARTGDYLVLDSALVDNKVRLYVYDATSTTLFPVLNRTISIPVTAATLGTDETAETNFKIAYNERNNVLFLIAPTSKRVYALSLPALL